MSARAWRRTPTCRASRVAASWAIPTLLLVLAPATHCGTSDRSPCPSKVPVDQAYCNSGGVVIYCHYGCTPDAATTYYATCSGPRWTVVASGLDCPRDAGTD